MQSLLKISQQTLWQLLAKIVSSLTTFIVLGLIARNFGESGTGTYTLAIAYLGIFFLLSDFGFNAHVLQRFQDKSQIEEFGKLLGTRILWSAILVVLAVGLLPIWPFASVDFAMSILLGSLAIVVYSVFTTCNLIFQSKLRYDLATTSIVGGTLVWVLIVIYFLQVKLPIPFFIFSHLLSWLIITPLALMFTKRLIKNLALRFDLGYVKKIFKDSWPIAATLALNVVYFRADAFILSSVRGTSEVGIYNVAYSVFQSVLVLPTFLMNSFYPMMLMVLKVNVARFRKQIKVVALGLLLLSCLVLFATLMLAPFIIKLLTGAGFSGSVTSLQILSLGLPAYFLSALLMWVMVAKGMYKRMLAVYALGLVINITSNLIFIPQYSYIASSWITVISEYLILIMQIFLFRGILFP